MPTKFYAANLWIVVLILAPNLLMFIRPPVNTPTHTAASGPMWTAVGVVEWVGRLGSFTLPLLYPIVSGKWSRAAVGIMALSLLVYYVGWARYALGGGEYRLLFAPLGFLLLPLAVAPIVYFLGVSLLLNSYPLALATCILALGHIPESLRQLASTTTLPH